MNRRKRFSLWGWFALACLLLAACGQKVETQLYLLLSGESENWMVENYTLQILPEMIEAGGATLWMKDPEVPSTDTILIKVQAIIRGEEVELQGISGRGIGYSIPISPYSLGWIRSNPPLVTGDPITLDDIEAIYMDILWHDPMGRDQSERIQLYQKNASLQMGFGWLPGLATNHIFSSSRNPLSPFWREIFSFWATWRLLERFARYWSPLCFLSITRNHFLIGNDQCPFIFRCSPYSMVTHGKDLRVPVPSWRGHIPCKQKGAGPHEQMQGSSISGENTPLASPPAPLASPPAGAASTGARSSAVAPQSE